MLPKESYSNLKNTCIDLSFLKKRTKSNPILMTEMIFLYLEQTPALIKIMKQSLFDKDWNSLCKAAHKLTPSFSIMGISDEFESVAKKIQEHTANPVDTEAITPLVLELEKICTQACKELEAEYNLLNN